MNFKSSNKKGKKKKENKLKKIKKDKIKQFDLFKSIKKNHLLVLSNEDIFIKRK